MSISVYVQDKEKHSEGLLSSWEGHGVVAGEYGDLWLNWMTIGYDAAGSKTDVSSI